MGGSKNRGKTPQNGWFIMVMKTPIKLGWFWGVKTPLFLVQHPNNGWGLSGIFSEVSMPIRSPGRTLNGPGRLGDPKKARRKCSLNLSRRPTFLHPWRAREQCPSHVILYTMTLASIDIGHGHASLRHITSPIDYLEFLFAYGCLTQWRQTPGRLHGNPLNMDLNLM